MTTSSNPLAGRNFQDENGNPIVPGPRLGVGGGGTVYEVDGQPDAALKIWHDDAIPEDAEVKIRHMVNNPVIPELGASWRITWPRHMVTENGNIVGYVMPKLDYTLPWQPIIGYYNQSAARGTGANQGREIRIENRVRIASNLALGFKAVHDAGYVIGDINQSNAEANRLDDVALMDCDSYGFTEPVTGRVFSDNYSQDGYQAPEFQDGFIRGPEQDRFGLAVLIFFLLTGSHPYLVTGHHADDYKSYSERIKAWLFPPASGGSVSAPDQYNEAWDRLTEKQQELFLRCFDQDNEGEPRPTPQEWVEALQEMPDAPPAPAQPQQPQSQPPQQQPQQPPPQPQQQPPPPQPQPHPPRRRRGGYQGDPELLQGGLLTASAIAGYGALIPLTIFSDFRPWLWLSLMLVSALFLYLPARRLLRTPITRLRWGIIAVGAFVSILFLLGLAETALMTWPWWLWLGAGMAAAFVFLVPARGAFNSSNARRRYVTMGAASLVAVFILVGMGMAGFREWQDWRWQRSLNTANASNVSGDAPSAQGNAVNAGGASGGAAVPLVVPTDTPEPTPTETPIPPTDTPLPPTATPMPTATTPPTPTPLPTATPIPTSVPTVAPPTPAPVLTVLTPTVNPGEATAVQLSGFPPYTLVHQVSIQGFDILGSRTINTDANGAAWIEGLVVPVTMAAGIYDVWVAVGDLSAAAGQLAVVAIPPTPTPPPYPDPALLAQRGAPPGHLSRAPGVGQYVSGCFVGARTRQQYWLYLADRPSANLENAQNTILLEFRKTIPREELREVIPGKCYYVGPVMYQTDESTKRCPGAVYDTACSEDVMSSDSFRLYVTEGTLREITEAPQFGN